MPADYSGKCPKPGFWVWHRAGTFWFQSADPGAVWQARWNNVHGIGIFVVLTEDYFTPELNLKLPEE
jgi:hypothetical protein